MKSEAIDGRGNSDFRSSNESMKSLRDDAVALAHDVKDHGGKVISENIENLKSASEDEFHKIEEYVRKNPAQSVLLAFGVGFAVNFLVGGRR